MHDYYILDEDHNAINVDVETWANWFQNGDQRRVAQTDVGYINVSTIFLGLNHRFGDDGPPLIFETMAFPTAQGVIEDEEYMERYSTWDEAVEGHQRAVEWARCFLPPEKPKHYEVPNRVRRKLRIKDG